MDKEEIIGRHKEIMIQEGIKLQDLKSDEYVLVGVLRGPKTLEHPLGKIKKTMCLKNQVQTAYKTHVADALSDQGEAQMGWMATGSGTGQAVGDATLATEEDRQALDGGTPTHAAAVVTYHRLFAAGEGTAVMTEAGVFNATPAGTLGLYNDSINFDKGVADSLELTWTMTVS